MKLLLTSGGLTNQTIVKALDELAGKPLDQLKVAFIPTASNIVEGDKGWLIDDLRRLSFLKFKEIDIVDISTLPQKVWQPRLENADVLFVEGGNTYYLIHCFNKSGLSKILPELLKNRVYIGVSAGSMVVCSSIENDDEYSNEREDFLKIDKQITQQGVGLVDFMVEPHINTSYFPEINLENLEKSSQKYQYPIYGIDDDTAIKIDGDNVEVVSQGVWKKFEK